jgi:murein DD-endopeptidase MepM/ murein hydrolase activator NlpD
VASTADQLRLRRKGDTLTQERNEQPEGREACRSGAPTDPPRGGRPPGTRSLQRLAVIAVLTFTLSAWLAVTTVGYTTQRKLAATLLARIDTLQNDNAEHQREIRSLTELHDEMAAWLAASEQDLRRVTEQRDRARREMQDLTGAVDERASLADRLATTQARLIEVSDERDAGRLAEAPLRWQLANLQTQLERLGAQRALAQSWLKGWMLGNVETLEELVAGTGVDLETLVARAATWEVGQGGPLEAMDETSPEEVALADPVTGDIQRLTALQKLASTLPLASPLDQFRITSPFGKRQDPFTKGWAFHSGLDLGAAAGSKVLATAAGTVIVAERSGPYGNMVEIDHGMGVITRYCHLKSIAVSVGDQVTFRQNIGVIGTTGRSTSLHLHYEVRVDGEPYDPSRFLDAGRYLVGIFDTGTMGTKALGHEG